MKLELRDASIKCKKLRRNNLATGTLRKNGKIIPISIKGSDIDKYSKRKGLIENLKLDFDGSEIEVKVINVERDLLKHNITNIDFEIA
ncbi:MAG: hypothetical protein ACRDDL_05885 [Sarcina sp.]